jgi:hypothetical protein
MPTATRPCHTCGTVLPQLSVDSNALDCIVRALSKGSQTIAALELRHFASCSDQEATRWVDHLLACVFTWPSSEADEAELGKIDRAFGGIEKPEHFTNYAHCEECLHHDNTLRSRTRETLRREDLGNPGWDPISFCSPEGCGYLFPALARFALLPSVWRNNDWYGQQLLFHLSYEDAENEFFRWCSPAQRAAVSGFLRYLMETRAPAVSEHGCDDELLSALQVWDTAG